MHQEVTSLDAATVLFTLHPRDKHQLLEANLKQVWGTWDSYPIEVRGVRRHSALFLAKLAKMEHFCRNEILILLQHLTVCFLPKQGTKRAPLLITGIFLWLFFFWRKCVTLYQNFIIPLSWQVMGEGIWRHKDCLAPKGIVNCSWHHSANSVAANAK